MIDYHVFCPKVAKDLGVKEGILYAYIKTRCENNSSSIKFVKFGEAWMSESVLEMSKNLGYLSSHQVKDAIDSLVTCGLIQRARFDGTKSNWYSLKKDKV